METTKSVSSIGADPLPFVHQHCTNRRKGRQYTYDENVEGCDEREKTGGELHAHDSVRRLNGEAALFSIPPPYLPPDLRDKHFIAVRITINALP